MERLQIFFYLISDFYPDHSKQITNTTKVTKDFGPYNKLNVYQMSAKPKLIKSPSFSIKEKNILLNSQKEIPRNNGIRSSSTRSTKITRSKSRSINTNENIRLESSENITKKNCQNFSMFDGFGVGFFLGSNMEFTKEIDKLINKLKLEEIDNKLDNPFGNEKYLKELEGIIGKQASKNINNNLVKKSSLNEEITSISKVSENKPTIQTSNEKEQNLNSNIKISEKSNENSLKKRKSSDGIVTTTNNESNNFKKGNINEEEKDLEYSDDFEFDNSGINSNEKNENEPTKNETINNSENSNNNPEITIKNESDIILKRYGFTDDFKKALGGISDLNLKMFWRCLAFALQKHIQFSRGCILLSELGEKIFKYQDNRILDITVHPQEAII